MTGAGSKMMRSVGKGVAAMGTSKEFQKKRGQSFAKQSDTVQEGFARAGRRLVVVRPAPCLSLPLGFGSGGH